MPSIKHFLVKITDLIKKEKKILRNLDNIRILSVMRKEIRLSLDF